MKNSSFGWVLFILFICIYSIILYSSKLFACAHNFILVNIRLDDILYYFQREVRKHIDFCPCACGCTKLTRNEFIKADFQKISPRRSAVPLDHSNILAEVAF